MHSGQKNLNDDKGNDYFFIIRSFFTEILIHIEKCNNDNYSQWFSYWFLSVFLNIDHLIHLITEISMLFNINDNSHAENSMVFLKSMSHQGDLKKLKLKNLQVLFPCQIYI